MPTKEKVRKNDFMGPGKGPDTLPPQCRECYGFSNWVGDKDGTPYDDRDCANCGVRILASR